MNWSDKVVEIKLKKYNNFIIKFCKMKNISPDLKSFLNYKENEKQFVSSTYKYLFRAPKELFLTKSFFDYYKLLDYDIAKSIISYNEIISMKLKTNNEKRCLIKKILKEEVI